MLRSSKVDAKYNVTTEFPNFGLHQAAATGNVGLVKYALAQGQPINSVLDGVLPLHAACSGGKELVVRLLIEHGADVNAPRLPRRYSNDRGRSSPSSLAVGVSGSTPLHFAAANGHEGVVRILLLRGAHADRSDKHRETPEALARRNGHTRCADVLRDWVRDKDRDLREREGVPIVNGSGAHGGGGDMRKRLQVKRSIDHALNMLKSSPAPPSPIDDQSPSPTPASAAAAATPFGQYTFYNNAAAASTDDIAGGRRPSLPQIWESRPKKSRRPRSAGMDAEESPQQQQQQQRQAPSCHRIGPKLSFLSLIKKGSDGEERAPCASHSKPVPIHPNHSVDGISPVDSSPSSSNWHGHGPTAVELHNALERDGYRARSGSRSSDAPPPRSPPSRPGVLLGHTRSSSSGYNNSASRLRFDSVSTNNSSASLIAAHKGTTSPRQLPNGLPASRPLKGSSSASSLGYERRPSAGSERIGLRSPDSAPPHTLEFENPHSRLLEEDDEEEDFGQPLEHPTVTAVREARRGRGHSITSSTSSLSPVMSPDAVSSGAVDYQFTLPPPEGPEESRLGVARDTGNAANTNSHNNRMRGGSVSSMSTANSSGSGLTTPAPGARLPLPVPREISSLESIPQSPNLLSPSSSLSPSPLPSPPAGRKIVDLELGGISSHAQASAFVHRTQQSILDMQFAEDGAHKDGEDGTTPLSAMLAAYGESLELERQLKQQEQEQAQARVRDKDKERRQPQPQPISMPIPSSRDRDREQVTQKLREESSLAGSVPANEAGGHLAVEDHDHVSPTAAAGRTVAQSNGPSTAAFAGAGALDRHSSLTHRRKVVPKQPKLKRPHTSGATSEGWDHTYDGPGPGRIGAPMHAQSRSVSYNVVVQIDGVNGDGQALPAEITIVQTGPTPLQTPTNEQGPPVPEPLTTPAVSPVHRQPLPATPRTPRQAQETYSDDEDARTPVHSRPLTPELYHNSDGSTDNFTGGVPLTRITTAPCPSSAASDGFGFRRQQQRRNFSSTNKLMRMGFAGVSDRPSPSPVPTAPIAKAGSRFGGLKALFKGKS